MTTVQMVARQVPYWTTVYRRTWRGGIVSSVVQPLLYVVAMGLLLGQYVGGGDRLGGAASYLVFIAPGLAATQSMMIAFGEAAWPVMGMLTWDKVYTAMAASPLRPRDILAAHLGFIGFRVVTSLAVFMTVLGFFGVYGSLLGAFVALVVQLLIGLAVASVVFAYTANLRGDAGLSTLYRLALVPLFLFSGAFFPVSALSPVLQTLAQATPLYHGVELTRMLCAGLVDLDAAGWHVAYLVAMTALGWVLSERALTRRLVS